MIPSIDIVISLSPDKFFLALFTAFIKLILAFGESKGSMPYFFWNSYAAFSAIRKSKSLAPQNRSDVTDIILINSLVNSA